MKRLGILVLASVVLAGIPNSGNASEAVAFNVTPWVALAPANVNVRARVERNSDNRGLEISAESDEFFRSSYISLDGDRAPSVTEVSFKGLPGGQYRISVVLHGSHGVRDSVSKALTIVTSSNER
jgi:hypothetical protein